MKLINLLSPKQNRIKAIESESCLSKWGYNLLGISESFIRGGLIGSLATSVLSDIKNAPYGVFIGGLCDSCYYLDELNKLKRIKNTVELEQRLGQKL